MVRVWDLLEALGVDMDQCHGCDVLSGVETDAEVRLADQPNWPFERTVGQVVILDPEAPDEDEERELEEALRENPLDQGALAEKARREAREPNKVVYIAEGSTLGYLPGSASKALGWR